MVCAEIDTGSSLLAAILANPADDEPRLQYSDWLEEHAEELECGECEGGKLKINGFVGCKCESCGDSGRISNGFAERAEFIRVQVELARRYPNWSGIPADDSLARGGDYDVLRRRERELFASEVSSQMRHESWYPELPVWVVLPLTNWSRGFVSSLTCSWQDWLAHADAILAAQPIERVRLTTSIELLIKVNAFEFAGVSIPYEHAWYDADGLIPSNDEARVHRNLLLFRWPGIEFELPQIQG